jgi:hypothetical protein
MHSHEYSSLLQPPDLLTGHLRHLSDSSTKHLFPSSLAPEQFARCDAACFVKESTDYFWVEEESEGFGAVTASGGKSVSVDGNSAAKRILATTGGKEMAREVETQLPFGTHEHVASVVKDESHFHDCDIDPARENLTWIGSNPSR